MCVDLAYDCTFKRNDDAHPAIYPSCWALIGGRERCAVQRVPDPLSGYVNQEFGPGQRNLAAQAQTSGLNLNCRGRADFEPQTAIFAVEC